MINLSNSFESFFDTPKQNIKHFFILYDFYPRTVFTFVESTHANSISAFH